MLKPHQKVRFQLGPEIGGTGKIVGTATTEIPFMGKLYIIEMENPEQCGVDVSTYPYPCIAVPEISIAVIN